MKLKSILLLPIVPIIITVSNLGYGQNWNFQNDKNNNRKVV
jgi:uncharacterized phage infection (PIP) family protein YhgE